MAASSRSRHPSLRRALRRQLSSGLYRRTGDRAGDGEDYLLSNSGFGLGVVVPEQHLPQQAPHAHAMASTSMSFIACPKPTDRTAGGYVASGAMPHGGRDGQWVRCDPSGHCQWTGRTSVVIARLRIYESTRGPLPRGSHPEVACGSARCVNLDHVRIVSNNRVAADPSGIGTCQRGHELTVGSVVRHRDGRIAYCRVCRNMQRRERYRRDPIFALAEVERQRRLRREARST